MTRTKDRTSAIHAGSAPAGEPCRDCPWRVANHGKRHPGGFYRKDNLKRLWNQIRKGGGMQTCHPTDPSHPDHRRFAGAKESSTAQECIGSVVLITRELRLAARLGGSEEVLGEEGGKAYLKIAKARRGLTLEGILWAGAYRSMPRPIGLGRPMPGVPRALMDADWIGRAEDPDGHRRQKGTS